MYGLCQFVIPFLNETKLYQEEACNNGIYAGVWLLRASKLSGSYQTSSFEPEVWVKHFKCSFLPTAIIPLKSQ